MTPDRLGSSAVAIAGTHQELATSKSWETQPGERNSLGFPLFPIEFRLASVRAHQEI